MEPSVARQKRNPLRGLSADKQTSYTPISGSVHGTRDCNMSCLVFGIGLRHETANLKIQPELVMDHSNLLYGSLWLRGDVQC